MNPRPGDPRRVLLVMPCHRMVRAAVAAGFRVWAMCDPARSEPGCLEEIRRMSAWLSPVDGDDAAGLLALVTDTVHRHGIGSVLHLGEGPGRTATCAAADALGLALTSAGSVRHLSDPASTRRLLNESGTTSGHCVGSPDEPAFGVQTLSVEGAHHVLGIVTRHGDGRGTTTHVYPARLAPTEGAQTRAVVTALLDLADYQFGPAYTEVVLTARGAHVVAATPGFGPGRIPDLIRLASGCDPRAFLFRALAGEPVAQPVPRTAAAALSFDLGPTGFAGGEDLDEIGALPYVRALHVPRAGQPARRAGHAVVEATTPSQATARIATVRGLIAAALRAPAGCAPDPTSMETSR